MIFFYFSQEKSCQLPKRHKGPKLSSSGTTDSGICVYVMGPLHQIIHPTVGSRPKKCGKIRDRGLQNHQQPQSDDRRPWVGTSLPAKDQLQIGNGVPYHIWTHRHSSATVSASISIEHSGPHSALHDSLLQDRCLPEFIFPSAVRLWNQLRRLLYLSPTLDDFKMGLASQE